MLNKHRFFLFKNGVRVGFTVIHYNKNRTFRQGVKQLREEALPLVCNNSDANFFVQITPFPIRDFS